MPELFERLPDFHNIGNRLNQSWIESWVQQPDDHCPSVAPEAADIAAYLATLSGVELAEAKGDAQTGEELHLDPWVEELTAEAKHTPAGLANSCINPTNITLTPPSPTCILGRKRLPTLPPGFPPSSPRLLRPLRVTLPKEKQW